MSFSLSNGEIIAIVTLLVTCPPSIALVVHYVRRARRNNQPDQTDVELADRPAQPTMNVLIDSPVDLLVTQPGLAHVPGHQSPTSVGSLGESTIEKQR